MFSISLSPCFHISSLFSLAMSPYFIVFIGLPHSIYGDFTDTSRGNITLHSERRLSCVRGVLRGHAMNHVFVKKKKEKKQSTRDQAQVQTHTHSHTNRHNLSLSFSISLLQETIESEAAKRSDITRPQPMHNTASK